MPSDSTWSYRFWPTGCRITGELQYFSTLSPISYLQALKFHIIHLSMKMTPAGVWPLEAFSWTGPNAATNSHLEPVRVVRMLLALTFDVVTWRRRLQRVLHSVSVKMLCPAALCYWEEQPSCGAGSRFYKDFQQWERKISLCRFSPRLINQSPATRPAVPGPCSWNRDCQLLQLLLSFCSFPLLLRDDLSTIKC